MPSSSSRASSRPTMAPTLLQPKPATAPVASTPPPSQPRPPSRYLRPTDTRNTTPSRAQETYINEKIAIQTGAGDSGGSTIASGSRSNTTAEEWNMDEKDQQHPRQRSTSVDVQRQQSRPRGTYYPATVSHPLIPPRRHHHHRHQRIQLSPSSAFVPANLKPWYPMIAWCLTTLLFLVAIAFWRSELFQGLDDLSGWLKGQEYQGEAIFFFLIFITTFPPLPLYSTLIILSGYTYGTVHGLVLSASSALFGALVVFLISRYLLPASPLPPSLCRIVRAISVRPSILFLIRLAPYPYNVLNAVLGSASDISLGRYMLITALSLPKLVIHTAVGSGIRSFKGYHVKPVDGSTPDPVSEEDDDEAEEWARIWTIFGIALCVVLFIYLWWIAQRAVDETEDSILPRGRSATRGSSISVPREAGERVAFLDDVEASAGMGESPFRSNNVLHSQRERERERDRGPEVFGNMAVGLGTDHDPAGGGGNFVFTMDERGR